MLDISQRIDENLFLKRAREKARNRKRIADKKKNELDANKGRSTGSADIAYALLKYDAFDFDDYLKDSIGIERAKMPQVNKEVIDEFLIHFANKYNVRKETVPAIKLRPTQNEINKSKVREMIRSGESAWKNRVFLVSKEYRIADGHHQHLTALIEEPETNVTVYRTNLDIRKMLDILRRMKITQFRDVNDRGIKKHT